MWGFPGRSLVEFPPAIAFGRLYFANNDGVLFAVNAKTGKLVWQYRSGRVQASSPTIAGRTVFHTFLYRHNVRGRAQDGELIAFNADTGEGALAQEARALRVVAARTPRAGLRRRLEREGLRLRSADGPPALDVPDGR